jgi:hypothetical protein
MHTKSKIDKIIHSDLKCLKGLPIEVIVSIIIQINYCDSDSGKIKIGKVKGQKRILAEGFTINTFLHAMVRHSKCSLPSSKHLTIL